MSSVPSVALQPPSDQHLVPIILNYQDVLEKSQSAKEPQKVLAVLNELTQFRWMNWNLLKETRIGKTVNHLRDHDGLIGTLSRDLVHAWKLLKPSKKKKTQVDSSSINKKLATVYKTDSLAGQSSHDNKSTKATAHIIIKTEKPDLTEIKNSSTGAPDTNEDNLTSFEVALKASAAATAAKISNSRKRTLSKSKNNANSDCKVSAKANFGGDKTSPKLVVKTEKPDWYESKSSLASSSSAVKKGDDLPSFEETLKAVGMSSSTKDSKSRKKSHKSKHDSRTKTSNCTSSTKVGEKAYSKVVVKTEKPDFYNYKHTLDHSASAVKQGDGSASFGDDLQPTSKSTETKDYQSEHSKQPSKHMSGTQKSCKVTIDHNSTDKSEKESLSPADGQNNATSPSVTTSSSPVDADAVTPKEVPTETKSDDNKPKRTLNLADYKARRRSIDSSTSESSDKSPVDADAERVPTLAELQTNLNLIMAMVQEQKARGNTVNTESGAPINSNNNSAGASNLADYSDRSATGNGKRSNKTPNNHTSNGQFKCVKVDKNSFSSAKSTDQSRDQMRMDDSDKQSRKRDHSSRKRESQNKVDSSSKVEREPKPSSNQKEYSTHKSSSSKSKNSSSQNRQSEKERISLNSCVSQSKHCIANASTHYEGADKERSSKRDEKEVEKFGRPSTSQRLEKKSDKSLTRKHAKSHKSNKRDDHRSHKSRADRKEQAHDRSGKSGSRNDRSRSPLESGKRAQTPHVEKTKVSLPESVEAKTHRTSKRKASDSGFNASDGQSFEDLMSNVSYPTQSKKKKVAIPVNKSSSLTKTSDADILIGAFPEILSEYKPLPKIAQGFEEPVEKTVSRPELTFSDIKASSRSDAVYSGRKRGLAAMLSLEEQCIQVLGNHIDDIGYVGGVPFRLIESVLKKATARQLYRIEEYNRDFLADTDLLWKEHCAREFRGQKPEEFESWRELYWRKFDERESKLKMLHNKIAAKEQQKQSAARKSMVAYAMSSTPKPPREVRRQQAKYGTGSGSMESTARAAAIIKVENTMRPTTSRGTGGSGPSTSGARYPGVKTIAAPPLMKKARKFMSQLHR